LPIFIFTFLLMILLASLSLSTPRARENRAPGFRFSTLCNPSVASFFMVCFLLQLSHGPYYTFYSLYLVEHYHYSRTATGLLWALGVVAEVGIFLMMHQLVRRFGVRVLLLCSLLLAAVRWLVIGYGAHSLSLLLIAQ